MVGIGDAAEAEWAQFAFRLGAGADHCPQIHHRLIELANALGRGNVFADFPQSVFYLFLARPAFDGIAAGQDAFYVAVEDWVVLAERQRQHCACR